MNHVAMPMLNDHENSLGILTKISENPELTFEKHNLLRF